MATNIAAALPQRAAAAPDQPAVAEIHRAGRGFRTAIRTYRELDADSDRAAWGLRKSGIAPGDRVVLMVPPSLDFFALAFGLFKLGAVPVLVDPGMGLAALKQCLAEAAPMAFVGIPKAHAARTVFGWAKTTLRVRIVVRGWWPGAVQLPDVPGPAFPVHDPAPGDPAAILFTSGSTGPPKGAVYTHGNFLAQVAMLRDAFGIEPGEIDLPTFPLFALFAPALGMTSVLPPMDFARPARVDPAMLLRLAHAWGITTMFGSPAVIARLAEHHQCTGEKLPDTLRRTISAGAPMSPRILSNFVPMLPRHAEAFTPYGATEALPVAVVGHREILAVAERTDAGAGVCVGKPLPGATVRIIPIHERPMPTWDESRCRPPGEIGEICVRGAMVTASYCGRPAATAAAKIADPAGGVWHRMGDCGYFDDQGRLWFCGRKAHRVILPDRTLFTDQVEPIFNTQAAVRRTALVGIVRHGAVEPALCVEPLLPLGEDPERSLFPALRELGAAHPHTATVRTFLLHPGFPVDIRHNAKIFREQLALWAARKLGGEPFRPDEDVPA